MSHNKDKDYVGGGAKLLSYYKRVQFTRGHDIFSIKLVHLCLRKFYFDANNNNHTLQLSIVKRQTKMPQNNVNTKEMQSRKRVATR